MKPILLLALAALGLGACQVPLALQPDYGRPLPAGAPALLPLERGEQPPDLVATWQQRDEVLPALVRSIDWTRREYAERFFPIEGIDHARALASLERFHELLVESTSGEAFDAAVAREFQVFKSAGWDGRGGGVLFTGYYTPILDGRIQPDVIYRHPLYGLPDDLEKGAQGEILGQRSADGLRPYPTRRTIEASGMLAGRGLELVWMRDPLDAYLAHVNGSAFVDVGGAELLRLGYAGKNGREYSSLGAQLVQDGLLASDEVSLARLRSFFRENSELAPEYLGRNDSFVFFTPIEGTPRGSLNVEVSPARSIATDKTLFPRGALVFVDTLLVDPEGGFLPFQQLMLDQDTGGAIRTAGRADLYFGIGPDAEKYAGTTRAEGQMYYLFLRE